ncbi:TIR protein [Candidatus Vecturithrix granuli]|uniref:TIR protein n=1 Tax=Vecturithrix granuli TaxID=1499967 RepID=A0A081C1B2_VECG1|nr:TIR protein [Candidatus Vecturithrix granuli]
MDRYLQSMEIPEIFISYSWRDESLTITEALDAFLQAQGITVVRDNRDIGYKGLIKEYMQQLGKGKYVVVVLSDAYFKSKSCMFELLELSRQEGLYDRIFPVTVEGLSIYEAEDLLRYARYWDEKVEHLQQEIKSTPNIANLQGITDDLNLYVEIRQNISRLIDFLRNINTHPLKGSNFEPLLQAIRTKMAQDRTIPVSVEKEVKPMELTVSLRRQIIEFFLSIPDIYNPGKPQALVQSANLDSQLLNQISFAGAPGQFFNLLLPILIQYGRLNDGRYALQAVLEAAKQFVGPDRKAVCDNLIRELGWIPVGGNATFDGVSFGHANKFINKVTNAGDLVQADDITITKTATTQTEMPIAEVLKLFEQMLTTVNDVEGVSRRKKIEAEAEVKKAIAEIEEPEQGKEPDKRTIANHLKKATETLKEAGATTLQAAMFGKLVGQAVEWLGTKYC